MNIKQLTALVLLTGLHLAALDDTVLAQEQKTWMVSPQCKSAYDALRSVGDYIGYLSERQYSRAAAQELVKVAIPQYRVHSDNLAKVCPTDFFVAVIEAEQPRLGLYAQAAMQSRCEVISPRRFTAKLACQNGLEPVGGY